MVRERVRRIGLLTTPSTHSIGHFGDETFPEIDCIVTEIRHNTAYFTCG